MTSSYRSIRTERIALNNLGVALYNLGRYQEAEQRYREAIESIPNMPRP